MTRSSIKAYEKMGEKIMDREQTARNNHRSRYNCASSVYSAFSDKVSVTAPIPRSEGGKCGAVLEREKVLRHIGMSTDSFDEKFVSLFGSLKCAELRGGNHPCNDLVGGAARLDEEKLGA